MNEAEFRSQDNRNTKSFSEKLGEVTKIATSPGNADANDYMRGMANGLILAEAIYKDIEPAYIEGELAPNFNYPAEATLTLSDQFHGELVSKTAFTKALNDSIHVLNKLDMVKKSLFYGRDNNLTSEGLRDTSDLPTMIVAANIHSEETISREDAINLIHGVIGMATEAGEMLEALRDNINGKPIDFANVKEEIGDSKWYMAILSRVARFVWGDDEKINIAKLRARFPNAFTEYDANNRNLVGERVILEGDAANQMALPIGYRDNPMPGEIHVSPARSAPTPEEIARYEAGGGYIPGASSKSVG